MSISSASTKRHSMASSDDMPDDLCFSTRACAIRAGVPGSGLGPEVAVRLVCAPQPSTAAWRATALPSKDAHAGIVPVDTDTSVRIAQEKVRVVQPDQEQGWRARPMPDSRCGEPPLGAVVKTSAGPDGTLLAGVSPFP